MSDTIQLEYDQLRSISQKLNREQADVQKLLTRLTSQMEVLRGGKWKAEAATRFYGDMDSNLIPRMQKLIKALQMTQDAITQTVNNVRQADEANQSLM
jgi:WXG100 family type VII secretion target